MQEHEVVDLEALSKEQLIGLIFHQQFNLGNLQRTLDFAAAENAGLKAQVQHLYRILGKRIAEIRVVEVAEPDLPDLSTPEPDKAEGDESDEMDEETRKKWMNKEYNA